MNRLFTRLATVALTLPLAAGVVGAATTANALEPIGTTVPGCYGAVYNWAVVCDFTVRVETPEPVFTADTVKVCAGDCYNVPVTKVSVAPGTKARLCYSYRDGAGYTYSACSDTVTAVIDLSWLADLFVCSADDPCVE